MAEAAHLLRATIRRATFDDLGAIREIYNHAVLNTDATLDDVARSHAEMAVWFRAHSDTHPVFVADFNGEVVGYGALSLFAQRGGYRVSAEISVYVVPGRQRAGVGTALCRVMTAHAVDCGLASVTALVTASNSCSRRLFAAAGYEHQGRLARIGAKFGQIIDLEIYQWFDHDVSRFGAEP